MTKMDKRGLTDDAHISVFKLLIEGLLFNLLNENEAKPEDAAALGAQFAARWNSPKEIGNLTAEEKAVFLSAGDDMIASIFDSVERRLRGGGEDQGC